MVTQVLKPTVEYVNKEIPFVQTEGVERLVEVPHVLQQETVLEVPEVQVAEAIREVPEQFVQEVARQVPKVSTTYQEKVVEVEFGIQQSDPKSRNLGTGPGYAAASGGYNLPSTSILSASAIPSVPLTASVPTTQTFQSASANEMYNGSASYAAGGSVRASSGYGKPLSSGILRDEYGRSY